MKKKIVWPRKFRLRGGFVDDTEYLAFYRSGHVRLYLRGGKYKVALGYTLTYAKNTVRAGAWEELVD